MFKKKKTAIDIPREDKIMYTVVYIMLGLILIIVIYPLIYVLSSSFSSGRAVSNGLVVLLPVEPTTLGYDIVFSYKQVWTGFKNAIIITVVGTAIDLFVTTLAAYPLSRKDLMFKKVYMTYFMICMFIGGGIIPTYILIANLKLTNTLWSVILSGCLGITNMIIMRTYFINSIPYELFEAARIDGITDIGYLLKIVLPLSKAIMAVITLYYTVGHWNSYFSAMLYIRDRSLLPLQVVLRDILNASKVDLSQIDDAESLERLQAAADLMKYSLIVISSVPMLVAYPFVQKYFEKGVMIGSVKC